MSDGYRQNADVDARLKEIDERLDRLADNDRRVRWRSIAWPLSVGIMVAGALAFGAILGAGVIKADGVEKAAKNLANGEAYKLRVEYDHQEHEEKAKQEEASATKSREIYLCRVTPYDYGSGTDGATHYKILGLSESDPDGEHTDLGHFVTFSEALKTVKDIGCPLLKKGEQSTGIVAPVQDAKP